MATNKRTPLHNETLFSAEEWSRITPGELWYQDPKREQPVTVLGHTFKNDDERRQWFREELRKKLPELKQMEGYPIGEDDDIINLSDPPYYTACPNPWLNDFIAEWEQEKKQLEAEGKRDADAVVTEPYASDVSEGKNNPIYMAHSYHTKVPHPAIMRYILHYTQPGDIIFDGFAGTGMTGVAANLCGSISEVEKLKEKDIKVGVRHSICSDLSPIASLISASYNLSFDTKVFEAKANTILDQVEKEFGWMYETEINGSKAKVNYFIWSQVFTCPNCGSEINLWKESAIDNGKILKSEFPCPYCGSICSKKNMEPFMESYYDQIQEKTSLRAKRLPCRVNYTYHGRRGEKDADASDFQTYEKIQKTEFPYKLKTVRMPNGRESRRNDKFGILYTYQYFTYRNLLIIEKIKSLIGSDIHLNAWLTSTFINISKMWKFKPDRKGGNLAGTFYVPSLDIEQNPIEVLRRKIKFFTSTWYKQRGNSLIGLMSATDLSNIREESVDYMFVDPPFGINIMYSELNSIWESYLHILTNNKDEAIVDPVAQHKNLFDYQTLMNRSLKEFYRLLKPGKWLTMEFSNTSASVWNAIQNALQGVGFIVANVAALDKKQGSFKAITTTTAVKQDLVISCYKPSDEFTRKIEKSADKRQNVWDFIGEHLQHLPVHIERGNATTTVIERSPKILYDRLISYYVQHGYSIPMDAQQFQQGLKERFLERDDMFFTAKQAAEYEEKKKHTTGVAPMGLIVSDEANGIEWLKHQLKEPKTYSEISPEWMAAINGVKKGDVLPELKEILEENFIEDEQGKWHVPDLEKAIDLEKLHHKSLMREFNLYKEQAQKPRARIREVRVEALREGFKECFKDKDFQTILLIADKIPQNILTEDEQLLQYYDIASMRA